MSLEASKRLLLDDFQRLMNHGDLALAADLVGARRLEGDRRWYQRTLG
jgi:hypothetical protein